MNETERSRVPTHIEEPPQGKLPPPEDIQSLQRPVRPLMLYYALRSLTAGPAFPILLAVLYFRYRTLRYRFDEEGVSMSWGVMFRREIHLTYARIQDIHLTSNAVERRLGLARIQIQTASGAAAAEMTIEGIEQYSELRDFLYERMRGARETKRPQKPKGPSAGTQDALAAALRETAAELRALREEIRQLPRGGDEWTG